MVLPCLIALAIASGAPCLSASTLFFSGNLRTDATVTSCGALCTLGAANSTGDYAQYAAVVDTFTVLRTTSLEAITYSYGGGTSLTGAAVAPGGLEPYLSLFNSSGNFLASTYGAPCPPGGNLYAGNCYDVSLNGGVLLPGTYKIALTAYLNMSYAENLGTGTLSDGFTGLGNLASGENLNYAFDVILPSNTSPIPEPNFLVPMGIAFAATVVSRSRQLRYARRSKISTLRRA